MSRMVYDSIYPLTVTADRYSGTYSGGNFIAWNLKPSDVPTEPFGSDVECMTFWNCNSTVICGKGSTLEEAVENLCALVGGDTSG